MANQPNITIPVAWGAARTDLVTIPASTSSAGVASWSAGFPTECGTPLTQGGVPPRYVDFNTILNNLSQFAVYQQCGGTFVWNNAVDYPVGCIAQGSDGNLYTALIANGPSTTVKNPVGDTSGKWAKIATAGDLANVVTVSGSQTVSGAKTFSGATIFSGGVTVRNQANFSSGATFSSGLDVKSGATVSGGATISGGITASAGDIAVLRTSAAATVSVDNGYTDSRAHKVALYANQYGNAGVYDTTNSAWIVYNNSTGATIVPKQTTFQSGAVISGGLTISGNSPVLVGSGTALGYIASNTGGNTRRIDFRAQSNGNAGIWDTENGHWMIHATSGGKTAICPAGSTSDIFLEDVASNTTYSAGNNLMCFAANNFKIQGGSLSISSGGTAINFPKAFTSAATVRIIAQNVPSATPTTSTYLTMVDSSTITASGCTVHPMQITAGGLSEKGTSVKCQWIAIGV